MPILSIVRPGSGLARLGAWLGRAGGVARQVLGVPDYERYLADALDHDPHTVPLGRDEFVAARLRARYDTPGSRCC